MMSVKVARNRLMVSSVQRCTELYQQLFKNVSSFQDLGNRIVGATEAAQAFRQVEKVNELALFLSNFPLKEFRLIGQYYLGWCAYRNGKEARGIFEEVLEKSETYKAKALMTLGALESKTGNFETELKYFLEALSHSDSLATSIKILRGIAAVKAKEGYHKHALKDLERIAPYFFYSYLQTPYDCWNSYAVELAETGRVEEARNVCRITLASPYAFAYPEWRATSDDIERKGYRLSRSAVFIRNNPTNVVRLPEPEPGTANSAPARILNYTEWKEKMVKTNGEENDKPQTTSDRLVKILGLVNQDLTDDDLDKIIELLQKLHTKKKP